MATGAISSPLAIRLGVPATAAVPARCVFVNLQNRCPRKWCGRVEAIRSRRRRTPPEDDDKNKDKSGDSEELKNDRIYPDSGQADPPETTAGDAAENEDDLGAQHTAFSKNAKVNGVASGSPLLNKLKVLSDKYTGTVSTPVASPDVEDEDEDVLEGVSVTELEDESSEETQGAPKTAEVRAAKPAKTVKTEGTRIVKAGSTRIADTERIKDESFDLDVERLAMEENVIKEPRFKMTLSELLDQANVVPLSVAGDLEVVITGMQHDSRQVNPGDLFVCCGGQTVDGHDFANQAAEQGAVVVVASKNVQVGDNVKAVVRVEDTSAILSALAAAFYGDPSDNLAVVGITGTNGKTTTSYLLKSIYEFMGLKTGLIGTIGYHIHGKHKQEASHTTPDAISLQKLMSTMVHNGTEVCVMEVSSHALSQGRCKELDFDVAVFTNLTRDHLDYHKSEEEYKEAKGLLFAKMVDPARHRKVVNIDDPSASYFIAQGSPKVPVITYGTNKSADVHPLDVQLSLFETDVLVKTPKGNIEISSGLLGRPNVMNILAAVSVGIAVDAPLEDIVRGIEEVDSVPGRFELVDEEQAFAVIVDYAHTPDALSRLLDTVRECGPRRIVTVVGCGGDRDRGKRPVMAKIAAEKSDVCIFTSDNPRTEDPLEILDDMLAGVGWSMEEYLACGQKNYYPPIWNGKKVYVHDLRKIAVRAAVAMGAEGDAIVVAGKGHERYQIVKDEKKFHDDREECREALLHIDMLHASGIDTSDIPWKFPGHKP